MQTARSRVSPGLLTPGGETNTPTPACVQQTQACTTSPRHEELTAHHSLSTRKSVKVLDSEPEGNSAVQMQIHTALYIAVWLENQKASMSPP